ncbi:Predicted dehydrogenase [Butyrivibrio sp. YAB3001]|nr:Predicted dehydrogenase [Butyrivibrio sp. YAB3001]
MNYKKDYVYFRRMKLGIIGTGRIAKRAVKELGEVEGIRLHAVYNPNLSHAKEFARQAGGRISATDDLDGFLDAVDAVYIASPHESHYFYAKKALEGGIHVICEKPMAFEESRARELYAIAQSKNCVLMEAVKTAYCPGFKEIERVIESGTIGEVVDVEAAFTRLTSIGLRELEDVKYGGAFTEFGTYTLLPIFRFLGTEYKEVVFNSVKADTGVDGYTKVFLNYDESMVKMAQSKTGLTVKSEGQLLISGTKGYLIVPSPWWLTRYFEVRYEDPTIIKKYYCEFEGDGLRYEFGEFFKRVQEKGLMVSKDYELEMEEAIARAGVFERFLKTRQML